MIRNKIICLWIISILYSCGIPTFVYIEKPVNSNTGTKGELVRATIDYETFGELLSPQFLLFSRYYVEEKSKDLGDLDLDDLNGTDSVKYLEDRGYSPTPVCSERCRP